VQKRPGEAREVKRLDWIAEQQLFEPRLHSPHRIHITSTLHTISSRFHIRSKFKARVVLKEYGN
jgi:hypothetical protein